MGFNKTAALKAGYTPEEIDAYLGKKQIKTPVTESATPDNNPTKGIARGGSNLLRALGLGLGPDLAGNAYTLLNNNTIDEGNPFTSPEQYKTMAKEGPFMTAGKDALGAASWAIPFGKAAQAARIPKMAQPIVSGAAQGGLQGASQPEATPGSIAQSAALSGVLAPLMGFLAHPIKPFTNWVDDILAKSGKSVDIGDVTKTLQSEDVPRNLRKFPVDELNQTANRITGVDIPARVKRLQGQLPANQMQSMNLPMSPANELKREIYDTAYESGKDPAKNVYAGLSKELGRLLKEAIEVQEPGVAFPNKIASSLYKVPRVVNTVNQALPFGTGKLVNLLGGLGIKGMQAAIPSGGGYLQRLLPTLLNLNNQGSQSR